MPTFKFISLLVFLAVFINGKANSSQLGIEKGGYSKKINLDQKIKSDDQDEDSEQKRKRKPRGIEVDVPQISDVSFEQIFVYTTFDPLWIEGSYISLLHCVHLKRGPPLS